MVGWLRSALQAHHGRVGAAARRSILMPWHHGQDSYRLSYRSRGQINWLTEKHGHWAPSAARQVLKGGEVAA
jgi:hypothetical protein